MKAIDIDLEKFAAAGLVFEREGESKSAWFKIPSGIEGVSDRLVGVRADSSRLLFFPERSAGQREVLKKLGVE